MHVTRDLSTSRAKGTRHDWLVARVCQVGVRAVQSSRRGADTRGMRHPLRRGRKRATEEGRPPREPSHDAGATESLEDGGDDRLHGVSGRYLVASRDNAEAHATALVLGRLYLTASARNIPERSLPHLLAMLYQAGAPVGQLHHQHYSARAFLHICCAMRLAWLRRDFWKSPTNLRHPLRGA